MLEEDNLQDFTKSNQKTNLALKCKFIDGLTAILIGAYAFVGAFVGNYLINSYQNIENGISLLPISFFEILLIAVALIILSLSVGTAFFFTRKKFKQDCNLEFKKRLKHFIVPFITGGIFCIVLFQYSYINLILPCTLIFYGLACVNASKFTFENNYYLGISNIIIGLIATQFIEYSFHFWALGFGGTHFIYGLLLLKKFKK